MLPLVPYTIAARRFLYLVLGTTLSLPALHSAEATGLAAPQEAPIDTAVRQCNEAWQHGRWKDAEKVCSALLEQADRLPDSDPKKARYLFQVVPLYKRSVDSKKLAIGLLRRILVIDEKALGPDDPQVALDLLELGAEYEFTREPVDPERFFRRAVKIAEATQPTNSFVEVQVLFRAAEFYRNQERYPEAEALLREAMEMGSDLAPRHKAILVDLRARLAEVLRKEGKTDEAERLLAEPVPQGRVSNTTVEATDGIGSWNDYLQARAYKDQGRLQEAELHYWLVISAPEAAGRPYLDMAMDQLANICHSQHRDGEAEELLLRALHLLEREVSEHNPQSNPHLAAILSAPHALENFYRDQGRLSEIEPVYKRALEIQEKYYGPTDDSLSVTLWSLAAVYEEEQKVEEALPLLRRAFQIKEKNLGADDPQSIFILEQYANTLQELGRTEEADEVRARAKQLSVAKKASH